MAHALAPDDRHARVRGNQLVRLGWPHFWMLGGILGGMLALVLLVFFIQLYPR